MIRSLAITNDLEIIRDIPLDKLSDANIKWYWVDFDIPTEAEATLLENHFRFHPLAVEDCYHLLQRPKMDHYENMHFLLCMPLIRRHLPLKKLTYF